MAGPTRDSDFSDYVAARQHALLRTAYVLTGDRHSAEDLLQTALAKTYLSWGRVRDLRAADGYVRRIMVNEHTGLVAAGVAAQGAEHRRRPGAAGIGGRRRRHAHR